MPTICDWCLLRDGQECQPWILWVQTNLVVTDQSKNMPSTYGTLLKLEWDEAEDLNNGVWIWEKWWIFALASDYYSSLLLYRRSRTIAEKLKDYLTN